MIEGYQIFCGHTSKHNNNLYEGWLEDMNVVGLLGRDLYHNCIWSKSGNTPLDEAKRLAEAGLILLEDSPNGPMATLTWRGSYGIRNL